MDSAIESVRKRYRVIATYRHISEGEAAMKTEAIVSVVAGFLRRQRSPQPRAGEEGVVCGL